MSYAYISICMYKMWTWIWNYAIFSDPAITKCPECGQEVRKKFGAVGVVFKGSGFYRTDSREKKKTETKPKKDEKAKDTAKKETPKPEKKATKAKTDK